MHTFTNRSLSFLMIILLAVQINAQETQKIDKTDSLQDIYSIQASPPAIYFKNNSSNTLATINEETDGRNAKFGSLSLQKAAGSVSSAMDNKLWIDLNDNLKFGNSTLTGIWTFNGALGMDLGEWEQSNKSVGGLWNYGHSLSIKYPRSKEC